MEPLHVPQTFPIIDNRFQKNDECIPTGQIGIVAADPMKVATFSQMVDMVAKLAYFNRRYVLFFRGQAQEHELGTRFPTIYPTYFREYLNGKDIQELKNILDNSQEELKFRNHNRAPRFHGSNSILSSLHVRWALLQHYNVCDTPMVDITQSLHVAASFALDNMQEKDEYRTGIVYVLALPWPSKNYHNNKEEDLYMVRLAGITPPQAKRPYRQEAYAVMSSDVDFKQTDNLERYNLANRLVCKFEINNSKEFWGERMLVLPESYLVPKGDVFYDFMKTKNDFSLNAR